MKNVFLLALLICFALTVNGQTNLKGNVVTDSIYSRNLLNDFGENPTRSVSVYLPPNYVTSNKKYPVIYFLHGFLTDDKLMGQMKDLLD